MLTFDTEGCGFHGMSVLLQYAVDDGDVLMYNLWKKTMGETLELLEWVASQEICGFNLAFDWFHLNRFYTTLLQFNNPDAIPEDHIDEMAICEEKARFLDFVIKPKAACDVMLHARKGPYQSLMARKEVRVKRIPTVLAEAVRSTLEKTVELDGIYFAKRKDPTAPQWQIRNITKDNGEIDPNFKNIVLKFHPSGQLKELARHALGVKEDLILKFTDIEVDPHWRPVELGYAPFALAIGKPGNWKGAWPEVIKHHINHWAYNALARRYGQDDVIYTRGLYKHFGSPEPGDDDSELACMVGAARWRGFNIDVDKIHLQRVKALKKKGTTPTAPHVAKMYLYEVMDETERIALVEGTKAIILESIAGKEDKSGVWDHSKGWINEDGVPHPAAVRAREILESRRAAKEIENYDKFLKAKHFHASFKVIGALSSRMSGTDKLNPQGVKAKKEVRICFPLADFDSGEVLSGGDFASFEVVLAAAVYQDDKLTADLQRGKNIFALFGEGLFDVDYADIMGTKDTSNLYTDSKRGVYSQLYGGDEHTMEDRLGVELEVAKKASDAFMDRYPGVRRARESITERFCSMRQPGGIGTAVEWHEPAEWAESLLGFKRYFTLENKICRALFDLAQKPPKEWKNVRIKVNRRDRLQTASGACQSALYATAFNIQSTNMRQAANHEIQSSGAGITKRVQRRIWDIQPCGANPWQVRTFNVHDEIHTATRPQYVDQIAEVVQETVESFREKIPLIKIDWNKEEKTWADK